MILSENRYPLFGIMLLGSRGDYAQQAQALVGKLGVTCSAIRSSIDSSSRRSTRSAAIKVRMKRIGHRAPQRQFLTFWSHEMSLHLVAAMHRAHARAG
jgi:hypothetical protein